MNGIQILLELIKTLPAVFGLYFITLILSLPLGILGALLYTGKRTWIKKILTFYTWVFRGTPLMLQLLLVYYGLPLVRIFGYRIILGPYSAAIFTFAINYAAYFIEIIRGGLESIDKGQLEATKVLGYTYWQTIIYVILPQAIRRVLPILGNEAISLIKDTSLIYVLAMTEVMKRAKELANTYYNVTPYFCAILIYLILSLAVDRIFKRIEAKNVMRV